MKYGKFFGICSDCILGRLHYSPGMIRNVIGSANLWIFLRVFLRYPLRKPLRESLSKFREHHNDDVSGRSFLGVCKCLVCKKKVFGAADPHGMYTPFPPFNFSVSVPVLQKEVAFSPAPARRALAVEVAIRLF